MALFCHLSFLLLPAESNAGKMQILTSFGSQKAQSVICTELFHQCRSKTEVLDVELGHGQSRVEFCAVNKIIFLELMREILYLNKQCILNVFL